MHLTREELIEIHNSLQPSKLFDKIDLALYPHKETINIIANNFPKASEIWKSETANSYMMKFYLKENEKLDISYKDIHMLNIESNPDVEIDFLECDEVDKGTKEDWMYSGFKIVYKRLY